MKHVVYIVEYRNGGDWIWFKPFATSAIFLHLVDAKSQAHLIRQWYPSAETRILQSSGEWIDVQ
jgi:hypothetical protein